jgi:hypothetical protein
MFARMFAPAIKDTPKSSVGDKICGHSGRAIASPKPRQTNWQALIADRQTTVKTVHARPVRHAARKMGAHEGKTAFPQGTDCGIDINNAEEAVGSAQARTAKS